MDQLTTVQLTADTDGDDNKEFLEMKGLGIGKGQSNRMQILSMNKIKLGGNSRLHVDHDELHGLMESIKQVGLLQPIGVIKNGTGYEIAYGNRRFLACSKLGLTKIPVVVHDRKDKNDIEVKNLTENLQRRNISLAEAGRYINLLKDNGLSSREIAVRLGVTASYVSDCTEAYQKVPAKFRNDLEIRVGGEKPTPGKIQIREATRILSAARTYDLKGSDVDVLFDAAKHSDRFNYRDIRQYAAELKRGNTKTFTKKIRPTKFLNVNFFIDQDHYDDLYKKYVDNGPYKSVTAVCRAILTGKISAKIKMMENR